MSETATVERTVRLHQAASDALDSMVADGGFASADEAVAAAIEAFTTSDLITDGDELDRLLDEAECDVGEYRDGWAVLERLRAKHQALADTAE